jgi:hypothetical protein
MGAIVRGEIAVFYGVKKYPFHAKRAFSSLKTPILSTKYMEYQRDIMVRGISPTHNATHIKDTEYSDQDSDSL